MVISPGESALSNVNRYTHQMNADNTTDQKDDSDYIESLDNTWNPQVLYTLRC